MWFAPASKKRKRPAQRHAKPNGLTIRQGHDADDDTQHCNLFKRIRIQGVGGSGRTSRTDRTQPFRSDPVSVEFLDDLNIADIAARAGEEPLNSASQSECSEGECDEHKWNEYVMESESKQGGIKRRTQPSRGDAVLIGLLGRLNKS